MVAIAFNGSSACHRVLIEVKAIDIKSFIPRHGGILRQTATSNQTYWAKYCLEHGANPNLNRVDGYKSVRAATQPSRAIKPSLNAFYVMARGSKAVAPSSWQLRRRGQMEAVRFLLARGAAADEQGDEDPTE